MRGFGAAAAHVTDDDDIAAIVDHARHHPGPTVLFVERMP